MWLNGKAQNRRFQIATYFKTMVWLCIAAGATVVVFRDHVPERVWDFVTLSSEGRTNVEEDPRGEIALAAMEKFQESPVFGGGMDTLSLDDGDHSSHNSYLYLLSTSGIVGFTLYGALVYSLVHSLWRIVRRRSTPVQIKILTTPALGGLAFLLVHLFFIDLVLSAHAWAFFGFAAAVAIRCTELSDCHTAHLRTQTCA